MGARQVGSRQQVGHMRNRHQATSVAATGDFVVQLARGNRVRTYRLSPAALTGGVAFGLSTVAVIAGAIVYFVFHDELLASLMERQTRMQYAYEDRIAALRLRLDQVASRQVIDQDGVEGKVQSLVMRQAQLETRAAVVAQLVERTIAPAKAMLAPSRAEAPKAAAPLVAAESPPTVLDAPSKPEPEGLELRRGDADAAPAPAPTGRANAAALETPAGNVPAFAQAARLFDGAPVPDAAAPLPVRLERLAHSLDRIEREQARRLSGIVRPAVEAATRLRTAFDIAGLPVDRYLLRGRRKGADRAVGGPFVDALADPTTPFEKTLAEAQSAVATLDGLRRALPMTPLRKPLLGALQMTSTFGYRTDPFLGRPALHSGVDLREDYGAPVRATAAGVVTAAGPQGGYGNLVEIDHGGGLATRYGHLSAINVVPGQQVGPGAVVGQVGSTGRSTGPHLHYEVRMDGEAVDPTRFLKAASALGGILQ
ncbi:peptidoglycan DD-metalloendopeptidase family protein [Methylocystis echinoides]|uniref:Membrane protein n=1 Tax=Methylocystis echinoides TaxID=29468 RepID=A0A9W6LQ68_9HYPH|nr:peptidoglycan DD-metalloendopeptidase family protein [Methylocystis echinoides]GLI91208.1 membrane protein [Methylocystis echinoides]